MNFNNLLKEVAVEDNLLTESGMRIPKDTKSAKIVFH